MAILLHNSMVTQSVKCMKATFCTTTTNMKQSNLKFIIAGGGAGGISMAARICKLGGKDVTIIEPSEVLYFVCMHICVLTLRQFWHLFSWNQFCLANVFKFV